MTSHIAANAMLRTSVRCFWADERWLLLRDGVILCCQTKDFGNAERNGRYSLCSMPFDAVSCLYDVSCLLQTLNCGLDIMNDRFASI